MAKSRNRLFADLVKTFYTGTGEEVAQTIRSKKAKRVSGQTKTLIDSVSAASVSAITFYISAEKNYDHHFTIISAVQKSSTDCDYSEFGTIITNSSLAEFEVRINSGDFELLATPTANNIDFKVTRIIVR
jgi:hypothetical protein